MTRIEGPIPLPLDELRSRLAAETGKRYWRSLEELAGSDAFQELLHREFPAEASEWLDPVARREFLKLMGASLALAGITGCTRQPKEAILPYVRAPEEIVPGRPLHFATAMPLGGYALGVVAESHMGRPTKIEGNPDHPSSLGRTDASAQASVLTLYDPDRSKTVTHLGEIRPWSELLGVIREARDTQRQLRGEGLRFLTETVTSPTLAHQLGRLLEKLPAARWHQWEPSGPDNARAGALLAFGEPVACRYRFDLADVIVALDADFITAIPGAVRYIREFTARRKPVGVPEARVRETSPPPNRLYAVESTPSLTGAMADHRLPLRASEIEGFARTLAAAVGVEGALREETSIHANWIAALTRDLGRHPGSSLILAGEPQPPAVHALAHAMNHALGNAGRTVVYTDPIEANPVDQAASLRDLVEDMEAGQVSLLVILCGNPVYGAPADLRFAERLEKVALRIHLGLYDDETAALCHWHVPEAHYLESWSDARAHDGTVTILQPLIEPLYGGKTAHELVAAFSGEPNRSSYDLVREHWAGRMPGDFERAWGRALRDGVVPGTTLEPRDVRLRLAPAGLPERRAAEPEQEAEEEGGLEIVFRLDPTVHDGRFANNGWLQELPKPLTKLTWDNAALVAPRTAERLGLANEDRVELEYEGRKVSAPVAILPGQPDGAVTVHLGYGRTRAGRVGTGAGFNAYVLRTSSAPWFGRGLRLRRTGGRQPLSVTQEHHSMEGRHLVRAGTLEEHLEDPAFARHLGHEPAPGESLFPAHPYSDHAWGMSIDLSTCVGCNACVVACQAENNIPIVGREEVARGREMHWLRIDRYYEGDLDDPDTYHQPVPCMHCENAPCEVVCPVAATVHSSEGLNDMVYNRCVGTRYCSNNCPYKVRRFNFFLYSDLTTPSLKMLRNPDVTVRTRGVMEKCTYCVQRINEARNRAKIEDRPIRDGEITTACQQACPADAIVFGDINDRGSRVSRSKAEPRSYGLLAELNTRPRTTYLAQLHNPNPEIERLR